MRLEGSVQEALGEEVFSDIKLKTTVKKIVSILKVLKRLSYTGGLNEVAESISE